MGTEMKDKMINHADVVQDQEGQDITK